MVFRIFMGQGISFQKLVLGDLTIETEEQRRKLLLGAYLITLYLGIDIFFFVVNLFNPFGSVTSLLFGISVSFICYVLIRNRWINTALFLHLLRANALAYYFSANDEDPYQTASYLYFIPSTLGAIAVFGYGERLKGIGFTIFSVILFLWAMFNPAKFSPDEAHFYFVTNFLIVLMIGLLILLFYNRIMVESETKTLQKNRELEKTNTELDRFVYSVSHDLRAPLSSILGLVTIYKYSKEDRERNDIVEHIELRALKLDEFIRDILNYARNSRIAVRKSPVNFQSLIGEVTENLRFIKGFDNITVKLDVNFNESIESDGERLKIIFNNLLSNAVKYQDARKEPIVKIKVEKNPKSLEIKVEDNGIGIKSEHLPRVFEMFYRANDIVEGSGLGLYIVKETVESLNGKIEMISEFTKGTSFKIVIPN